MIPRRLHALLGIGEREALLRPSGGRRKLGAPCDRIANRRGAGSTEAYFFRTSAGAEIDLLLKLPGRR